MEQRTLEHISSYEDPDRATAVAQAVMSGEDSQPKADPVIIARPPDCSVTLPGGIVSFVSDEVITEAEVRELTGADEEALSKADAMKSPVRYMQTLLSRGVVRIGDEEPPAKDTLASLLVGDRNMLLLAIRTATYGPEIELTVTCPNCREALLVTFDATKDIPIKELPDKMKRLYEVELRHGGKATVRLPTSEDQDAVLAEGAKQRSVAEMNTLMLSRCVQAINGHTIAGPGDVRGLGIKDRRTILDFLADIQPGPRYEEVSEECPACAEKVPVPLDLFDLFR